MDRIISTDQMYAYGVNGEVNSFDTAIFFPNTGGDSSQKRIVIPYGSARGYLNRWEALLNSEPSISLSRQIRKWYWSAVIATTLAFSIAIGGFVASMVWSNELLVGLGVLPSQLGEPREASDGVWSLVIGGVLVVGVAVLVQEFCLRRRRAEIAKWTSQEREMSRHLMVVVGDVSINRSISQFVMEAITPQLRDSFYSLEETGKNAQILQILNTLEREALQLQN